MNDTYGKSLRITLFGASHAEYIGIAVSGLPAGIALDYDKMRQFLAKRASFAALSTPRREADEVIILGGVFEGRTSGDALCLAIRNNDVNSKDYERLRSRPRASHADYTARVHNRGYNDYRGGGQFSGRMCAPIVALGAVLCSLLEARGIYLATHIVGAGSLTVPSVLGMGNEETKAMIMRIRNADFPVCSEEAQAAVVAQILKAKEASDSIGGILETVIVGVPAGIGEPFFSSLESEIAQLCFGIPAVKGIEFGIGFGFAAKHGSEVMDEYAQEGGSIVTLANHNGGIVGGIATGMPIVFRTAIKPPASVNVPMRTVNLESGENETIAIGGRHDSAIFHRAAVVQTSVCAVALCELLMRRYGYMYFAPEE